MIQEISVNIDFPEMPVWIARNNTSYAVNFEQLSFFQNKGIVLPDTLSQAVIKRQVEFAAGRFCAYQALQQLGYQGTVTLPIGTHRAPIWPDGYCGSISHSDGWAMAVAINKQQGQAVGVDIERILSDEVAHPLLAQIMTSAELTIGKQTGLSTAEWCSLVFSAKETLFKTLYPLVGRYFDFLDVEVCAWEKSCVVLSLVVNLSEYCLQGDRYSIHYQRFRHHVLTFCLLV